MSWVVYCNYCAIIYNYPNTLTLSQALSSYETLRQGCSAARVYAGSYPLHFKSKEVVYGQGPFVDHCLVLAKELE